MSQKDPIVIFYNGEEDFENLMEKLIYRKLQETRIEGKKANEMINNKNTRNGHLSKDS
jgi:hypothetical protein